MVLAAGLLASQSPTASSDAFHAAILATTMKTVVAANVSIA